LPNWLGTANLRSYFDFIFYLFIYFSPGTVHSNGGSSSQTASYILPLNHTARFHYQQMWWQICITSYTIYFFFLLTFLNLKQLLKIRKPPK